MTEVVALKQPNEESKRNVVELHREPTIIKRASTIMVTSQLMWFEDDYTVCDPLGEPGTFGMAFSCYKQDDPDKKLYAVKQINKGKFYHIQRDARFEIFKNMKNEIEVMRALHHKNIVSLHEVYEDRNYIYLIMDMLSGGELFQRITESDSLTERDAAVITKQILEALSYMHSNNICHLDLKPDNIMFESKAKDSPIKLIDFGMAQIVPRLKKMQHLVGTPYYTAPEILNGEYDRHADVWSVGVIVFCMLFGFPPFYVDASTLTYGKQEEDAIFESVQKGFTAEVREGYGAWFPEDIPVSAEAKSFIGGLLKISVAERMSVDECLAHPWIRGKASAKTLPKTVFDSLTTFNRTCKFKLVISKIFAKKLDPTRYAQTLEVFKKWDIDGDGEITLEEFKIGMRETTDLSDPEINEIFNNLDQDDSRTITIDELIVSAAHNALVSVDERMYQTFCQLDLDSDGLITVDELKKVIREYHGGGDDADNIEEIEEIESIIDEIDIDGDGNIDYEEFLHALHPQYNETLVVRDATAIRERGFGSFDQKQFSEFQSFLKTTDSRTALQYHWDLNSMRNNFQAFQRTKRFQKKKLSSVDETKEKSYSPMPPIEKNASSKPLMQQEEVNDEEEEEEEDVDREEKYHDDETDGDRKKPIDDNRSGHGQKYASHDANEYKAESKQKEKKPAMKKQFTFTRESERLDKYDKGEGCCDCSIL